MADTGKPNENRGNSKAEGERWTSEQNSVRKAEQETAPENSPPDDGDNADRATQWASGLGLVRPGPGPEVAEDLVNRNDEGRYDTPRRYETENDKI